MQQLFEKKFPPFAPRFERLQELLKKNREETASLLGISIQGLNKAIREDNTPDDRRMLVELMIEKLETQFHTPGSVLEGTIRELVKDEIRNSASSGDLRQVIVEAITEAALSELRAQGRQKPSTESQSRPGNEQRPSSPEGSTEQSREETGP